jgi:hypothetical protein
MKRILATLSLALLLALIPATSFAQDAGAPPGEEGGGSSGDPLYGYVGTAFFAALAMFAVCKSARR